MPLIISLNLINLVKLCPLVKYKRNFMKPTGSSMFQIDNLVKGCFIFVVNDLNNE